MDRGRSGRRLGRRGRVAPQLLRQLSIAQDFRGTVVAGARPDRDDVRRVLSVAVPELFLVSLDDLLLFSQVLLVLHLSQDCLLLLLWQRLEKAASVGFYFQSFVDEVGIVAG